MKGIKCYNTTTGKYILAYHIEDCGAAHNRLNTLCIGCIGINLILTSKK